MRQGCEPHGNQYGSAHHFGFHSRASFCASAICAGVMLEAALLQAEHSSLGHAPKLAAKT
jgi:hypothetical protein